jgi:hypothetical protein
VRWVTSSGVGRGFDAAGRPILGTPGGVNSAAGLADLLSPGCRGAACP